MIKLKRGVSLFIEAILIGIILGRFRSGNLSALEKINFKGLIFIVVMLILDIILRFFLSTSPLILADTLFIYYPTFSLGIYVATIIVLELNKHIKYMRLIEGGFVLNFLPMALNGGKMPVLESALVQIGKIQEAEIMKRGLMLGHQLIDESTRFKILSDFIPLNIFIPKVISIGDIVIALGIILFISHYMTKGRRINKKV